MPIRGIMCTMITSGFSEKHVREKIDSVLLKKAGWDASNSSDIITEFVIPGAFGSDEYLKENLLEYKTHGLTDYLMLDRSGEPLAILETKRTSRDPLAGKQQADVDI